ncbi:site-specific integrase [Flagellimonas hymeniacidonis]|uniref:Site-specific integrase n=1 Tax=Flagellimonas hymeniacidonis TaxID=2603628 RepID=A0A5C8V5M3_9FLAO|nr:site-specific integrase [Flagellimonas hymeniacidonis]TXN36078.1 site-specific integrase [Flagellimonas hymeniacidonis]
MDYNISYYLDKRFERTDNTYSIKLRVYSNLVKKSKLFSTKRSLSVEDFERFIYNKNLKGFKKDTKLELEALKVHAESIAKKLEPFTFEKFERRMYAKKNASINISHHYKNKIEALHYNEQLSTASNYDLSFKSLSKFVTANYKTLPENLTFYDITADWLEKYETFIVKNQKQSLTTVSIYLRMLRTVFNDAIRDNDIKQELYPFGKGKGLYQIPATKKKKKALSQQQLAILFNAEPQTKDQEMAKDFWFFSYACNGANIKDIIQLKWDNLDGDCINYFRAKTINTKKGNLTEISIFLNEYALSIIERYGNKNKNNYIFPVLKMDDDAMEQYRKTKNFTSFVNLHFNKLAKTQGFEFKISSYWARHSFATNAIRRGASMEFISDALNHSSLNVTKGYFAGFQDDVKKQFAKDLMNFE